MEWGSIKYSAQVLKQSIITSKASLQVKSKADPSPRAPSTGEASERQNTGKHRTPSARGNSLTVNEIWRRGGGALYRQQR